MVEERTMGLIVIGGIVGCLLLYVVYRLIQGQVRQKQWSAEAQRLGFDYEAEDPVSLMDYGRIKLFTFGSSQVAKNVLKGSLRGADLTLMDFHYTVRGGRASVTTRQSICLLKSPRLRLPNFYLRKRAMFYDDLTNAFGGRQVSFPEDPRFSNTFYLMGPDEATVRDLFTPAVRERLLIYQGSDVQIEGDGDLLLVHFGTYVKPSESAQLTDQALYLLEVFGGPVG